MTTTRKSNSWWWKEEKREKVKGNFNRFPLIREFEKRVRCFCTLFQDFFVRNSFETESFTLILHEILTFFTRSLRERWKIYWEIKWVWQRSHEILTEFSWNFLDFSRFFKLFLSFHNLMICLHFVKASDSFSLFPLHSPNIKHLT